MSDKTRQEFEAWAKAKGMNIVMHDGGEKYAFNHRCFEAWQHQQAIIDARDAEIVKLSKALDDAKNDTKRLDFLTAFENAWQCCWVKRGKGPVQWRMSEDGDWWGAKYLSAREAIDAAISKGKS